MPAFVWRSLDRTDHKPAAALAVYGPSESSERCVCSIPRRLFGGPSFHSSRRSPVASLSTLPHSWAPLTAARLAQSVWRRHPASSGQTLTCHTLQAGRRCLWSTALIRNNTRQVWTRYIISIFMPQDIINQDQWPWAYHFRTRKLNLTLASGEELMQLSHESFRNGRRAFGRLALKLGDLGMGI